VSDAEAVDEAIASARLEGLDLTPEFLADAERSAAGEIDADELVERTLARYRH
jgi:hypothetical protein